MLSTRFDTQSQSEVDVPAEQAINVPFDAMDAKDWVDRPYYERRLGKVEGGGLPTRLIR